jgi:DNA-binding Lrp family transcriptional regulator
LENVYADLGATISVVSSDIENFEKPKRNAFVFITTEPESSKSAFEDLKRLEEVKEVYLSHGAYDIVVKVSGESLNHLREIVSRRIMNLGNIKSTLILMVV